jgi:predicted nuclease of predicted toxin-antitoxin system
VPAEAKRILLDQNVPRPVADWLRSFFQGKVEVDHVYKAGLGGASDREIFGWAQENFATIVTYDEDFVDQRLFPVDRHCGVVRLRVDPTTIERTCQALGRLFNEFEFPSLAGKLVIVDDRRIRII